ncbi:unnamed protein product [Linum tenue]|uniref:Uncharacterized protein n=1 Tax=Linum tenue TaxID=586396 RepID=A0AAV0IML0_9ROSI|nr:unnamed protein product [Linum tenue]
MFFSENYITTTTMNPHHHQDDEFHYEPPPILPPPPPPSSSSKGFLEEFHNLDEEEDQDQVFRVVHNGCNFDSSGFDAFPYGSSSSNMDFYEYECKPFVDHHINSDTNFHNPGVTIPHRNNYNHHVTIAEMMGSSSSSSCNNNNNQMVNLGGAQEMKPLFSIPHELSSSSCLNLDNGGTYHHHQNQIADYGYKSRMSRSNAVTTHLTNRVSNRALGLPPTAKKTWKGRKKNNVVKGQWTVDEDRLLVQLVEQFGIRKWSHIAQMLPGRIGKQCRERWHNHLRPDIKKDTWTEEEDRVLIQSHGEIGNKWAEIAKRLPGRTENSIKNHWNATKRRQYSKRKCRSKYPRGSILQDYIKSLNLDNSSNLHGRRSTSKKKNNNNHQENGPCGNNNQQQQQQEESSLDEDLYENDRLVPNFDFGNEEVPDFGFDDKIFQDGCNIDSLLDGLPPCAPLLSVDGKRFDDEPEVTAEEDAAAAPAALDFEVKKELDLVEMMLVAQKKGF